MAILRYAPCSLVLCLTLPASSCGQSIPPDNAAQESGQDESEDKSEDKTEKDDDESASASDDATSEASNDDSGGEDGDPTASEDSSADDSESDAGSDDSGSDDETTGDSGDSDSGDDADCALGDWVDNRSDLRMPSSDPPCGLKPEKTPMFVVLGWDDNAEADGMSWSVAVAKNQRNNDGSDVLFTYYNTSTYVGSAGSEWKDAYDAGHEMGNHTINHATSKDTSLATWTEEMQGCHETMVDLGIASDDIFGFRTPFLGSADATIIAVQKMGYWYDCSLEEGFDPDQDGRNFLWPYTLDHGSPGNDLVVDELGWEAKGEVLDHPGLWELPAYALMVPGDDECPKYGCEPGLQTRIAEAIKANEMWDWKPPKLTGFDYNMWTSASVTQEELTAILKFTLDLRLEGNRAPLLIGMHSSYYVPAWDGNSANANSSERRAAIEDFIEYATSLADVRVTTAKNTLDWIRNPVALKP